MRYDDDYNEEPKILTHGLKNALKLKGKYLWNIIYTTLIWQLVFGVIYGLACFIMWETLKYSWLFIVWRGALLCGLFMGVLWMWGDYKIEKYKINLVADRLWLIFQNGLKTSINLTNKELARVVRRKRKWRKQKNIKKKKWQSIKEKKYFTQKVENLLDISIVERMWTYDNSKFRGCNGTYLYSLFFYRIFHSMFNGNITSIPRWVSIQWKKEVSKWEKDIEKDKKNKKTTVVNVKRHNKWQRKKNNNYWCMKYLTKMSNRRKKWKKNMKKWKQKN